MQQLEQSCSSGVKNAKAGIICKIGFRTAGRYGKATLLMLCVGFLFLITTANSYGVLRQELNAPYTLTGTVTGLADLGKYLEIPSLEAVTPVLSFESKLTAKGASVSGTVTAVLANYLELSFAYGNPFPNDSNMPFLVLNQYAAQNFSDENKKKSILSVNDTLSMTIEGEEETAIVCGIFEDGLEQPVIYMSYPLAARKLSKGESINLLLRLGKTEDLEDGAKAIKKLGVSVSYDEALPERWKRTKQQIYQTFLSALVLLICAAAQMAGQHRRELQEAMPERQALALSGLEERHLCLHGSDHGVVWPRAAGEAGSGEAAIRHDGGRQWGLKPAIRR